MENYSLDEVRSGVTAGQRANILNDVRLYELEKRMRIELEKQDKERAEFINSLVHEIKTPVTAMMASCDLLSEELASKPGIVGELVENLTLSINNLNNRVSELMDFAKFQNTEIKVNLKPTDMNQIAARTESLVFGMLKNKKQTLKCNLDTSSCLVQADPDRVVQVLLNLLTNASKYGQPERDIYLKTYRIAYHLITEIQDTAQPIPEEDKMLLFRPYQLAGKKANAGVGLGLFICQKLVELQGGEIWVEAGETGNRFMFSLPLAAREEGN